MSDTHKHPRTGMPKNDAIREFWSNTALWRFKGFDSKKEFVSGDYCFACGFTNSSCKTERAHIIALSVGGSNACENIHLLCGRCHIDSEGFGKDPFQKSYWDWFWNRTYDDRCLSAAIALGFNCDDAYHGGARLLLAAKSIFASRPDLIERLERAAT